MKAALMYGAGDVRVESIDEPSIQAPTDAVVRITRSCICGSDLHPYHGMSASPDGRAMGHEMIAVVEAVGRAVTTVRAGDFVVSSFSWQDNTCPACLDGVQTACHHGGYFGTPGSPGLQAELARVPLADGTLVRIPDVDPATADDGLLASLLALSDVYLTGYHAAFVGQVRPGNTVVVVGDGAVGLSAVLASKRLGAERIVLMGRHRTRTDLGVEWGATDVVAVRGDEAHAAVMEITGGLGAHVVLEAVGSKASGDQSFQLVRAGGVVSRVGVPQYRGAPAGFGSLFGRNVRLAGGVAPVRAYLDDALLDVLEGRVQPGRVFDRTIAFDEIPDGYAAMDSRAALKVMIRP